MKKARLQGETERNLGNNTNQQIAGRCERARMRTRAHAPPGGKNEVWMGKWGSQGGPRDPGRAGQGASGRRAPPRTLGRHWRRRAPRPPTPAGSGLNASPGTPIPFHKRYRISVFRPPAFDSNRGKYDPKCPLQRSFLARVCPYLQGTERGTLLVGAQVGPGAHPAPPQPSRGGRAEPASRPGLVLPRAAAGAGGRASSSSFSIKLKFHAGPYF